MRRVNKSTIYRTLTLAVILVIGGVVALSAAKAKETTTPTRVGYGACTRCYCDGFKGGGGNACTRSSCRHQYGDHK
jgi:hypothetical protein